MSPPSSPAAGRPGTAAPPGSWCGSGPLGQLVLRPRCRRRWFSLGRDSGGGSALCPAAQPSSVTGLDPRPRAAQALGQALQGDRYLSPSQALTPTWAPGTRTQALALTPAVSWRSSKRVCLNLGCSRPNVRVSLAVTWKPQFSSGQVSHSVMSNSLRPHGLQHAKPPCTSPTP